VSKAVQLQLKKILKPEVLAMLDFLASESVPIAIQDLDGEVLYGEISPESPNPIKGEKYAIGLGDRIVGWAIAERHGEKFADWLSAIWRLEMEKKVITNEALQRYTEINCLYHIAEGLVNCQGLQDIATLTLNSAKRVLEFNEATILVMRNQNQLEQVASFGMAENYTPNANTEPRIAIAKSVIEHQNGEVINDVIADPRFATAVNFSSVFSMVCVPLLGKKRVAGVILISSNQTIHYAASDLRLLKTIASQVAPAIDNFMTYEDKLHKAQEREQNLQQQLIELRLELEVDEVMRLKQVAEITETDQFKLLLQKAEAHRQRRNRHR
jgi:transcriptional regulator with GAF, ATPase, and Fis domain